jgi:hypothetical protein
MQSNHQHNTLCEHVIKTLLYFDIFNYPLKDKEVFHFLGMNSISGKDVTEVLENLVKNSYLFRFGEIYCLHPERSIVDRRLKGNETAKRFLPLAKEKAKLIAKFPFIRAVMASGSLSKGYMDEKSDLDFFIVTAPGRLWIARTLLVLYKRLFLGNSHQYFCVNYFVDENHLQIEEKNLFTATEIATVIPLYNAACYERLQHENSWVRKIFPNYEPMSLTDVEPYALNGFRKNCERFIDLLGNWLEQWCMHLHTKRLKRIYEKSYDTADFNVAFKSKKYTSKNHPNNYQKKVITKHQEKIEQFYQKFNNVGWRS